MKTIALVLAALALAGSGHTAATRTFENHVAGYTVVLPADWHAAVLRDDGSATIATYPVRATGNVSVPVPAGQTWIRLYDEGPLWTLPGWVARIGVLPQRLPPVRPYEIRVLGRSVEGRPIGVWRIGNPHSRRRVLVVGCIHGDECAGMAVTSRLVNLGQPTNLDLWVIQDLNPDGLHQGTRQNANGVDLNRNFGRMWQATGRPGSYQYSGPRPWSEPETRIARDLIRRIRPQITIWFHQPQALVRAWGPSTPTARRFARLAHVRYRSLPWPNGTAANWQNHAGMTSFVVELPAGPLDNNTADRYVKTILRLTPSPAHA